MLLTSSPHLGDARGADAQLAHSQADQQRHENGVRRRLAADLERAPGVLGGARDGRDPRQHARIVGSGGAGGEAVRAQDRRG